jgi:hypothetical protein
MEAEVSSKRPKRLWKNRELRDKLADYNIKLDECQKLFIVRVHFLARSVFPDMIFQMSTVTVIQRRLVDPPISLPEFSDGVNSIITKIIDAAEQSRNDLRVDLQGIIDRFGQTSFSMETTLPRTDVRANSVAETVANLYFYAKYPVLDHGQLEFENCLPRSREQPPYIDLYRGRLNLGSGSMRVIVKRYNPGPQAERVSQLTSTLFWSL